MNVPELFESSLRLIDRVARGVCRRARVEGADADDFVSAARLALLENDYAILRAYEGRSSLSTFLNVVLHRLLVNQRTRTLGKWNPSREAVKIGRTGVLLETLLRRDGRSIDEALPLLRNLDPALTRQQVEAMAARLPERTMRPRLVELNEDAGIAHPRETDRTVMEEETRALAARTGAVMREALAALPVEDRMLLRCRYAVGMSLSDIARILGVAQRPLYRRSEALLRRLRETLCAAGVDGKAAAEIVGSAVVDLDFGFAPLEIACDPPEEEMGGAAKEST